MYVNEVKVMTDDMWYVSVPGLPPPHGVQALVVADDSIEVEVEVIH